MLPGMLRSSGIGQFQDVVWQLYNRTGSATTKGGLYAIDGTSVQGESTSIATMLDNVTGVVTANFHGLLVLADDVIADNARGPFCVFGVRDAMVDGDAANVAVWDKLVPNNASAYLFPQNAGGGANLLINACAIALEANTGAAALKKVLFDGWVFKSMAPAS